MRGFVIAVAMMIMPFMGLAHQGEDGQAMCHKNTDGVLHCHIVED